MLDRQRLGKQRVETLQIMTALHEDRGWVNHPATLMWKGYECALMYYQIAVCGVWTDRGYSDTCLQKTFAVHKPFCPMRPARLVRKPPWHNSLAFHRSHKSNLIQKRPDIYGPLWPWIPDDLPYVWPVGKD